MKIIKYALLLSGLFFSSQSPAQEPIGDCKVGTPMAGVGCTVSAPKGGTYSVTWANRFSGSGRSASEAWSKLQLSWSSTADTCMSNGSTSKTVVSQRLDGPYAAGSYVGSFTGKTTCSYTVYNPVTKENESKTTSSNSDYTGISIEFKNSFYCPPEGPAFAAFNTLHHTGADTAVCSKPFDPVDCSGLKGLGASALYDSFTAKASAGYTKASPPSCLTKCAIDADGVQKCGDCKVAAASWSYQESVDKSTQKWWANAGTFTGAACGEKETETPPPEATKCWETTNGLSMCIQDPAEKCVTVSGVQQCEAGCGYINGAFYCADKEPPKPDPNDNDKPIPDPDDNISNPEKPIGDMNKGDFKDVQRGVESRVASVGIAVGNLENSVDGLGNTLDSMNDKLDKANGIGEAQLGYLKGIKEGILEGGEDGDGDGEPDGNCDPLKDKKCDGNTGASGIKSWWNSKYPDGINTLLSKKKNEFTESSAFQAMTQELTLTGGAAPDWRMCFDALGFGCYSLNVPPYIWNFIRACMLFGAAVLSRRLLIGG